MTKRLIILSGCSGGGKSTLLDMVARRGHAVVPEPGRRIIETGEAFPWIDMAAFARRAISVAIADWLATQEAEAFVFFDRGIVDAAAALDHVTGGDAVATIGRAYQYHDTVFLTPPWPEIYATDHARRHGFQEAVAEYDRLCAAYASLGYAIAILPRAPVAARADWMLSRL